ncbi:MarR family transcriptional regulator [Tsukamurella pulmonis]|uniref:MarR family winged helix-turn-helix transcriptional regulator n=1 Tax=Tsukamurella pulmonis TaxID=47312 RepID=UPI001E5B3F7D|nr:MarR family transcriptional regulator [Tsukamurella pulmonis]BDD81377.1 MarR family transcriptional regulator [Tsukamurella pulmonis]
MGAGDPRWLSTEEMAAWLPLIHVAMRLPAKLDTQLRSDAGITHYEFMVLSQLSQAPERTLGLSALAEAANSSPSRLSHVLRKLGDRGWLVRHAQGRSAYAELTDAGFAALDGAARGHVEEVRRLVFDHLADEDVAALRTALGKITPGLAGEA